MKIRDMIIKDLKIALSDKSAILLLLIMPMVLMTILGFSLAVTFDDLSSMEKLNIAIVKEYDIQSEKNEILKLIAMNTDTTPTDLDFSNYDIEKIFLNDFLGNEDLIDIIEYKEVSREEANQMLNNKEVTAMVILPKGFIKDTMINFGTSFRNVVEIKVIGRTDRNIGTTIVEEIIRGFTEMINYNISAKNSFNRLYSRLSLEDDIAIHIESVIERITDILNTERPKIKYEPLNNRPPMNSRSYYAFGMSAMFVLFSAGYGSKLLLEEKEMRTYDRMSASGVKQSTIVIGKTVTIFLIIFIQCIISYLFSTFVLKVGWGNIDYLMIIFIAASFSVAGLGILLASIVYKSGSYNMSNVFTSFIVQIMSVFGGNMVPLENMPSIAKSISNFTPNGLMLKALTKNYYGYGFKEFDNYLIVLILLGLIFIIASVAILLKGRRSNHVKHSSFKINEA